MFVFQAPEHPQQYDYETLLHLMIFMIICTTHLLYAFFAVYGNKRVYYVVIFGEALAPEAVKHIPVKHNSWFLMLFALANETD